MTKTRNLLRNTPFFTPFLDGVWTIQKGGLFLLTAISFSPVFFHVEEILFFILLGLVICTGWLEEKIESVRTPIDLPLFLLLVWILLTIPFSLNPEYSFAEWRKLLTQCLVFYWAIFVIRNISRRNQGGNPIFPFNWLKGILGKPDVPIVFLGVIIGASLLSCFSLVDFIQQGGHWQDRNIRAIAPGSDYNWLSTYLVLAIPIVVYFGMISRELSGKVLSWGIFLLALLAQAASYTRAGWLASVAQLFTLGLVTRRRFLLISVILAILLVPVAILLLTQMGYQANTLDTWTIKTRIQVWSLGVDQIISHPIVGIGFGNHIFQPVLVDSPMGNSPMHLHNFPLMVGVGSGIPGLVFLFWVFLRLGLELFPKKTPIPWTNLEILKVCLGIVLVGFFCRNLFDYMFAGSLAYLFWILMACGLGSQQNTPRDYKKAELEAG